MNPPPLLSIGFGGVYNYAKLSAIECLRPEANAVSPVILSYYSIIPGSGKRQQISKAVNVSICCLIMCHVKPCGAEAIHSKSEKVCGTAFAVKIFCGKVRKSGRLFASFWVIFGPLWIISGHSRAILGHIWATLDHFGSFLGHFVAFLDKFAES